ncbi:hypothetical protein OFM39_36570, partial [Escherichia coli]|nr:hypothetical protein [Escherichia coli]
LSMRLDNWPTDSTALPKDKANDEDVMQQPHGGVVGAEATEVLAQACCSAVLRRRRTHSTSESSYLFPFYWF